MDNSPMQSCGCSACAVLSEHGNLLNGNFEFYVHDSEPRNATDLIFKTLPFHRIIKQFFPMMMHINFSPMMSMVGPENVCNRAVARFYLSLSDVQKICDRKRVILLQIRIGEKLPEMSKLSEELPRPMILFINCREIPMDDIKSPLHVNAIDYLNLNTVNENTITINWPSCGRSFYLITNLVELIGVEELVEDIKMDNDRFFFALDTKKTAMELFRNSGKDLGLVAHKLTLLCPISKSIMKLPAKSVNCNHLQCFDLQAFISLNKIKPTWMCPICMKSCISDDLKIDSFLSFIINSKNLPKTCVEIELDANGKWRPCISNSDSNEGVLSTSYGPLDTSFLEIDLGNSDNENFGDSIKTVLPITTAGNSSTHTLETNTSPHTRRVQWFQIIKIA